MNRVVRKIAFDVKFGIVYVLDHIAVRIRIKKHMSMYSEKSRCKYYDNLDFAEHPEEIMDWYYMVSGKRFCLSNPNTYNEKIQWIKIYEDSPLRTQLADKYLARSWVADKIGEKYLIPLLGVWKSFDDIDFSALPNQFVLKCNHGCKMNLVVKDKSTLDTDYVHALFERWMNTNYSYQNMELQYRNIPRRIIAEQYLENTDDDLYDYKFWCFDGKCQFIMFLSERKNGLKMINFDLNWKPLPFTYDHEKCMETMERPSNLKEMIVLAEKLSKGFRHARVDFYRLNDGTIKFGEMTFTSAGGVQKWTPSEYNTIIGNLITLQRN